MRLEGPLEGRGHVADAFHPVRGPFQIQIRFRLPDRLADNTRPAVDFGGGIFQFGEGGIVHMDQEQHLVERLFHFLVERGKSQLEAGLIENVKELTPFFQPLLEQGNPLRGQTDPLLENGRQPGRALLFFHSRSRLGLRFFRVSRAFQESG